MYDLYVMTNKSHMHKIKCCSKGADKGVDVTPTFRVSLFISLFVDFLWIVYNPQTPYIIAVSLLAVGMICLAMSTLICWYVRTSFRQNLVVKQISVMCLSYRGTHIPRNNHAPEHKSWTRHDMETFSALLALCWRGLLWAEYTSHRPSYSNIPQ